MVRFWQDLKCIHLDSRAFRKSFEDPFGPKYPSKFFHEFENSLKTLNGPCALLGQIGERRRGAESLDSTLLFVKKPRFSQESSVIRRLRIYAALTVWLPLRPEPPA